MVVKKIEDDFKVKNLWSSSYYFKLSDYFANATLLVSLITVIFTCPG